MVWFLKAKKGGKGAAAGAAADSGSGSSSCCESFDHSNLERLLEANG